MTREEAVKEIEKAFEPAFANYIITALTEGATVSDKEPTTKNDLGVDYNIDDFIKYCKKTFGVELTVKKSDNPDTYTKLFGTTKNDLVVDCISRAYLLDDSKYHTVFNDDTGNFEDVVYREDIEKAPSVTPQEPFKPMVEIDLYSVIKQKYIEREVFDKIRAEIEEQVLESLSDGGDDWFTAEKVNECLDIIDKYKAESEGV